MSVGSAYRADGSTTAQKIVDSDVADRMVYLRPRGPALQRIAFDSSELTAPTGGFILPDQGVGFALAAGDEIWLRTAANDEASGTVSVLLTKVV